MPKILLNLQLFFLFFACSSTPTSKPLFLSKVIDLEKDALALFHLNESKNRPLGSFKTLMDQLNKEDKTLTFAMNAGMFHPNRAPVGLYIENGKEHTPLNTEKGKGNFYMQPNGVFYWTKDQEAKIVTTPNFKADPNILYATQSGPMLLINGALNTKFGEKSTSKHIRNGVGVLPNGHVLFVISTQKVNLYDFANYFKQQGCKNALYLDGFVSKIYAPDLDENRLGGNFGVMIGSWK